MRPDLARQSMVEGRAWQEFCDALRRAGEQVLRPEAPADPFNRAEGFRYLSRLIRAGLESCVEFADPDFPVFYSLAHETIKIGADNPDNLYLNARVDGRLEYRITGSRGTVHYLGISTKAGGYGTTGCMEPTGFVDSGTLQVAPDGSFEMTLSATPQPGNWLRMAPETEMLIVRQTFLDRTREVPARLEIERIPRGDNATPLDPGEFAAKLQGAGRFVEGTARLFADWVQGFAAHPNVLPPQDQRPYQAAGGDPSIHYYHGYWVLGDDEALVIEVPRAPECETWNFQLNNYWMESLDYRHHRIHVNKHTAAHNPDGSATLVVAHRDPGLPNWLDTAGHGLGTMCFRWIRAREIVHPSARVVKLRALR